MTLLLLKMPCQSMWGIETDCQEIIAKLKMKYGKYISDCEQPRTADIGILKGDSSIYTVTVGKTVWQTSNPLFYVDRFLFENPSYDINILALHGAAVEWKGKSYVFLAPTTTGKTTLTSYLTYCGCGYLAEDCVLLDRLTCKVYPFSRPLHLRKGGVDVLRQCHAIPMELQCLGDQNDSCRYIYTPQNSIEHELPLGEIYFIELTESRNAVLPMTSAEKMMALMKSPITMYPITKDYLRLLTNLSTKYCKRLQYCDMNFVKEVIMQDADQSST